MIQHHQPDLAQVIVLPRCRKRDGGCGSHDVWASGGTRTVGPRKIRHYVCRQCGRRFKVLVVQEED